MEHLAWPAVALVLGLVSVFAFKRDLGALIGRIRKIDKTGITAGAEQGQMLAEAKTNSFQELMDSFTSVAIKQRESNLKKELESKGIQNDQEKLRFLTRALAACALALQWEQIERAIFGSQVKLLVDLNTRGTQGVTMQEAQKCYEEAAVRYPETYKRYPFQNYLHYLQVNQLVVEQSSRLYIAQEGKEFLQWLVAVGRTYQRPN
jgi:hypothetical protein